MGNMWLRKSTIFSQDGQISGLRFGIAVLRPQALLRTHEHHGHPPDTASGDRGLTAGGPRCGAARQSWPPGLRKEAGITPWPVNAVSRGCDAQTFRISTALFQRLPGRM